MKFGKTMKIAAFTTAFLAGQNAFSQDMGMASEEPVTESRNTGSATNTLYYNPKMSQHSLLRSGGLLEFMNSNNLLVSIHKEWGVDDKELRARYSETGMGQMVLDNLAYSVKGNYVVKMGKNELNLSGKYYSMVNSEQQFQKEAEALVKLTLKQSGKTHVMGLKIIHDGESQAVVNGVGAIYGFSNPELNAGVGMDVQLKSGISRVFGAIDYLASNRLLLSGMVDKKFASENTLSAETFTVMVTYAGRKFAVGSSFGMEHVSQKLPESYIWAPNPSSPTRDANGINTHFSLTVTYNATKNVSIKPYITWDNLKKQPYDGRFNNLGAGVGIELNFSGNEKLMGSGQGHSGNDRQIQQNLSVSNLRKSDNDTYQRMQVAKAMMANMLGDQGAHGYPSKVKAKEMPMPLPIKR